MANTFAIVSAQEPRDRQHLESRRLERLMDRHGVGDKDAVERATSQALSRTCGRCGVSSARIDGRCAPLRELLRCAGKPLTAPDPILEHERDLPLDVAEDRHSTSVAPRVVVHDRELRVQHLRQPRPLLCPRRRGSNDDGVTAGRDLTEPLREHRQRRHVVDRDLEESLNLAGVEIHGQDAICTGVLDHVRDHAGSDRLAGRRLPVRRA